MKRVKRTDIAYVCRMVALINKARTEHKTCPMTQLSTTSRLNGRHIIHAWEENGCLMARSLNGEEFPVNVECVYDAFTGKKMRASTEPSVTTEQARQQRERLKTQAS